MVHTAMRLALLPGPSERYVQLPESELGEDLDTHPCKEDEEFFKSRQNTEATEQVISSSLFLDALPCLL